MMRPRISYLKAFLKFLNLFFSQPAGVGKVFKTRSFSIGAVSIAVGFICLSLPASGQIQIVRTDVHHDVSPPLRDLAKNAPLPEPEEREAEESKFIPLASGYKPAEAPDSVLQGAAARASDAFAPTPGLNFDGIGLGVPNGQQVHVAPPDTNGAVGATQYVQWVNVPIGIFDNATGNFVMSSPGNALWAGFGGSCESDNDGDPIVMYDKLADRWVLAQFAVCGPTGFGPFFQCVAVSTTSDATGTYNRYSFPYSAFDDYPKMGVWPDAYYATFNMFNATGNGFLGADACAYDRTAMLNGQAATQVCFQQGSSVGGLLPSDVDGHISPPAGSPNFMAFFGVNNLQLFKFHVDFATPSNSTFTGPTVIPVAPFTPLCPNIRGCVPQQGTTNTLDSLGDRLMYRLAYRNFGDHESLVVNHSVVVNTSSGIRWYELQNPNGAVTVAQQSTFAPDASFRWMGSIAMDQVGDIAVGYSVSSSTMFPSIAVAGRTFLDPPSTLQSEISVIAGGGSQGGTLTRWGDYSAMQIDPVDDCTFWYTTEYLKNSGTFNWNTRIASFKFPGCDKQDLTITSTHSGNFTQGQTGKTYTLAVKNTGDRDTDGSTVTVTDAMPTGLTVTSATGTGWSCTPGTTTVCTRNDVLAFGNSYPVITLTVNVAANAPGLLTNAAAVAGGGEINTSNDSASDVTTIIQTGPDPTITKTHSGSFIRGQTGTYTITVSNVGLTALDGTTVTVKDTFPTGLTLALNGASGTGWVCFQGTTIPQCTRGDVLAANASYPPITLTVNVATDAPARVINSVTVSGGGDVNALNDTATDPTITIPPPPDLTITKTHTGNFNQGQNSQSYTLTVSNASGANPTNGTVTVTDPIPTGLPLDNIFALNWSCSLNSGAVTCTRSDVLAGGSSYPTITVQVNVASDAPASAINTATVSGGGDVSPGNNTASDPTTINPSPDLTITKTHSPDPFTVGQTGTYTITVSNVGHAPTSGLVNVNDFLPSGLTATAVSATGWNCPNPLPTAFVNCTRSDALAAGSSYPVIALTASVTGGGPAVTNAAEVSGGGEFNLVNDTARDLTSINAPVLTITKSHIGNFTVGQSGTYTITVGNVGPIATLGTPVTVSDILPVGLTATAVSGTGWSCNATPTSFVNCTRSDVLASDVNYPPIAVTVAVDSNAAGLTTNVVSVIGAGDSNNHVAQDPTTIIVPDLATTETHSGNFIVGQTGAVYTITVSNVGAVATVAGGTISVTDSLPFSLSATAVSGTGWNCNISFAQQFNCARPSSDILAPGNSYPPITLTVNLGTFVPLPLINTVSVSGIGDANTSNNSFSDTATVLPAVTIVPTTSNTATVNAGTSATFSFTASLVTNPPVGALTFTTRDLPPNSKATFSPTSLTQTGSVTMTLDTSGNGHVASSAPVGFSRATSLYAALLFPLFGFLAFRISKRKGNK